jgi:hypothetical protein
MMNHFILLSFTRLPLGGTDRVNAELGSYCNQPISLLISPHAPTPDYKRCGDLCSRNFPTAAQKIGLLTGRPDGGDNRVELHAVTVKAFANICVALDYPSQ